MQQLAEVLIVKDKSLIYKRLKQLQVQYTAEEEVRLGKL
jgi:hypothetical protein